MQQHVETFQHQDEGEEQHYHQENDGNEDVSEASQNHYDRQDNGEDPYDPQEEEEGGGEEYYEQQQFNQDNEYDDNNYQENNEDKIEGGYSRENNYQEQEEEQEQEQEENQNNENEYIQQKQDVNMHLREQEEEEIDHYHKPSAESHSHIAHHPRSQIYPNPKSMVGVQKELRVISPNKSSKEVLQHVLDGDQYSTSDRQRMEMMRIITKNLQQINMSEQDENSQQQSEPLQEKENYEQDQDHHENQEEEDNDDEQQQQQEEEGDLIDLQLFDASYKAFLQKISEDQQFVDASYEQKIDILFQFTHHELLDYRLGSLIFMFELIYNFRESLTEVAVAHILQQIYTDISNYYSAKDFYMVFTSLEIIALVGPSTLSFQNIKLLASILINERLPILQDKAFLALISLGYPGFYALLDIANRDFNDVPIFLMNKFAQVEEVLLSTIIPSLINDVSTGDPKKKMTSLCALNRMHSLIWKANCLPFLVSILNEGSIDRQMVASTIRASGEIGEQTLLRILRTTASAKIKMAISTVLSWKVKKNEKNQLGIRIVQYNIAEHFNVNPGTMCQYYGNMAPLAFVEEENEADYIEINSRDFMAALQRLVSVKYEKFAASQNQQLDKNALRYNNSYLKEFTLVKLIDPNEGKEEELPSISYSVIKALSSLLQEKDPLVRESAISTLGIIGAPEAKQAIDPLFQCLNDQDSQVRAIAAWCLGRLGDVNPPKVAKKLIQMLKDNYWKVRTAACVSLGSLGPSSVDLALPALTKVLRDSSINRLTVCQTLVRVGSQGEQILLDLLKAMPQSNFKLKTSIIQAFELANVQKPSIDFIIEELFRNAADKMIEVRRACLQTLEILRKRSQDSNITYLKSKNILPLFYFFLQDSSSDIRNLAIESLSDFGPQAELMFIEGLTKDKNSIIRQECAKGLGLLGVQNVRALLFGLRDANEAVRKATAIAVQKNFTAEQIVEEFADKQNQLPALLCNIKDIFSLPFQLEEECKKILGLVLVAFGESIPQKQNVDQYKSNNFSFDKKSIKNSTDLLRGYNSLNHKQLVESKAENNIPNMRGGMPQFTYFKPGVAAPQIIS